MQLLFERSHTGRKCTILPACDVAVELPDASPVSYTHLHWAHRSRWKSEANVSPPRSSKASFIKDNHHSS